MVKKLFSVDWVISTHALTEGDWNCSEFEEENRVFQLTPSQRATHLRRHCLVHLGISTHALTEGDRFRLIIAFVAIISTHALTEGDCFVLLIICPLSQFQLTPSQRATTSPGILSSKQEISTHALTEGDVLRPGRGAVQPVISTHALTEGDCYRVITFFYFLLISTHALTEGDDF